jgi:L-threonylcarbamoyladenylate synthase
MRLSMTAVLRVDPVHPDPAVIATAAACLRGGGLVAFPTETVYGLGAHALDRHAVHRVFIAKGRPSNDPLIVHLADAADLGTVASDCPALVSRLAARFWPGPLTLVVRRGDRVPPEVTAGLETVAIRVPAHPVARALLQSAAVPVAAPSANRFTRPSPTRAEHVLQDLDGLIDILLDAGPTPLGLESTVLDLTATPPRVLRPGAVPVETLREVEPSIAIAGSQVDDTAAHRSPGLLSKHYAPTAPLVLHRGTATRALRAMESAARAALAAGTRVGVLVSARDAQAFRGMPVVVADIGMNDDAESAAARLYAALRELDAAGVDLILARDAERGDGLWLALRDRLHRAASSVVDHAAD